MIFWYPVNYEPPLELIVIGQRCIFHCSCSFSLYLLLDLHFDLCHKWNIWFF